MTVEKILVTLADGVLVPGNRESGPVQGEFTVYLGFAGNREEPPEDPHIEDVALRAADGTAVDLDDMTSDEWEQLDARLWKLANAWWAARAVGKNDALDDWDPPKDWDSPDEWLPF